MSERWRHASKVGRWAAAYGLALVLTACGLLPPVEPEYSTRFDILSVQPIAAGQVVLDHASGVTLGTVVPLRAGVIARAASDGTSTRVAWVATTASSGAQVQIAFDVPDGVSSPTVASRHAYTSAGADDQGVMLSLRATTSVATAAPPPPPIAFQHPDTLELAASFADHRLGDTNADGALDVRDALLALDAAKGAVSDPHALYHSDLTAGDATDLDDVGLLLDKIVDPNLPASLHVRPRHLSFVQLDPDEASRTALVLVGNRGNEPLAGVYASQPAGVSVSETGGGTGGHSAVFDLTIEKPTPLGWRPTTLTVSDGAGAEAEVLLGSLVVLIAGQSNASGRGLAVNGWDDPDPRVRMLGNDYVWKVALEPLDAIAGQIDVISMEEPGRARYSFGTRLASLLTEARGVPTFVIPAAKGSTSTDEWLPGSPIDDRADLFGSAAFRALVSAGSRSEPAASNAFASEGGPVTVVAWYQGESDATPGRRGDFIPHMHAIMDGFASVVGSPIVYAQLASSYDEQLNIRYHDIAERQRRMEAGSGDAEARGDLHMVVTHDLPRSDDKHLSAYGQRVLAERIALAVREHVLGEAVDGTGPRLESLRHQGAVVIVTTTQELSAEALDPERFRVYDGPPTGSIDNVEGYGDNFIGIIGVSRDPADPRTVRITLVAAPTSPTPYVRYMALPLVLPEKDDTESGVWEVVASGVVRGAASGLPLPVFGPLPAPQAP